MKIKQRVMRHGVFINIFGYGILLIGESGIGKSELALSLIDRGHRLIADDIAEFEKTNKNTLIGKCPKILQDLLEVRGLGVLNIRKLYGQQAIQTKATLNLIIELKKIKQITCQSRLDGLYGEENILQIAVPSMILPVSSGRELKVLTECAVLNQKLKKRGIDAKQELIQRQRQQLQKQPT